MLNTKLDPRTKMVLVFCLSGLALLYEEPLTLFILLIFTLALLFICHFQFKAVLAYLKPLAMLLICIFTIQLIFSASGSVWLSIGPINLITSGGLIAGGSVILRIIIVTAAAMLFSTFNARDLILGLVQWRMPYELAFMVSIALRFLPIIRDEFSSVVTAVQLRGVELKKIPWKEKFNMYKSLFFPITYGVLIKAQQLSIAMETRGFRAYHNRTYLRRLKMQTADYIVLMLSCTATAFLMFAHISGFKLITA